MESKVQNTCKLKLHIPLEIINNVFSELSNNIEISGVIYCDNKDNVVNFEKNKGESDSVYTPNNVINYHTHPISAYNNGKTVWGWPSGEDIRETIKFALAGNKAHLVFTVEGLYTIQISPCKLKKIKELSDSERGILIFMIEEYFKTTHNFRCVPEVNELHQNKTTITPYSFIDFANNFNLNNLLSNRKITHKITKTLQTKDIGHTGIHSENNIGKYSLDESFSKIPEEGFPDIDENVIITKPIKNYITKEELAQLRTIDKLGQEYSFGKNTIDQLILKFKKIAKKFDPKDCNKDWNNKNKNAWFFINFFPTVYYKQKGYLGRKFVTPNKNLKDSMILDHEPFIRIFSDKKEGCSINTISKNNNFKMGSNGLVFRNVPQNVSFGKTTLSLNEINKLINYLTN